MKKNILFLVLGVLAGAAIMQVGGKGPASSVIQAAGEKITRDVLYGPTPQAVVDEMVKIARISGQDTVYDLGCGDGRMVITAARDAGARGVGIEIDPRWLGECRRNAKTAGVQDRVQFRKEDFFKTNLSSASVVMLFLNPVTNLRMRPKFLQELAPGSRIVSHKYAMGEWEPDNSLRVGDQRSIYLWIIPANVSGKWNLVMSGGDRRELSVQQKFQQAAGSMTFKKSSLPLKNMSVNGDTVQFVVAQTAGGKTVPLTFIGHVRGNHMEGTVSSGNTPARWQADRDPSTIMSLEQQEEKQ